MATKGQRRRRRNQRKADFLRIFLGEEFPGSDSAWACDASVKGETTRIAVVPSSLDGEPRQGGRLIELPTGGIHASAQTELLAVLAAQVIAAAAGATSPIILNDHKGVARMLRFYLRLEYRRGSGRTRNFIEVPELRELVEALGDRAELVQIYWMARNSVPALARADRLAGKPQSPLIPEDSWEFISFDDLLATARLMQP